MKHSYTAASCLPVKILHNQELLKQLASGKLPPYHVQLFVTNKCNLKCSFCSCRNKGTEELTLQQIEQLAERLPALGCKAVTISGGGEPLCHPHINEIIGCLSGAGLQVGLTTNGTLLHLLTCNKLVWCRISASDERPLHSDHALSAITRLPSIDWSFSYVVGRRFKPENLKQHVQFANKHGFTHIRIVPDLNEVDAVPTVDELKAVLQGMDSRVIYQGRKDFAHGRKNCWISLLKPVVNADGWLYPCCGVQYANEPPALQMSPSMRMGQLDDLGRLVVPFDGSRCIRCYYDACNELLDILQLDVNHQAFL